MLDSENPRDIDQIGLIAGGKTPVPSHGMFAIAITNLLVEKPKPNCQKLAK
jgi:hypothetical protein